MKTCARCKTALPIEEFGIANRESGARNYNCKACVRAYGKAHYAKNRAAYLAKARRWENKTQAWVRAVKDRPCADCGGSFPFFVMDFDHLPGGEKAFTIGTKAKKHSAARVAEEVAKCEVVCANCHRIRTWNRHCAA